MHVTAPPPHPRSISVDHPLDTAGVCINIVAQIAYSINFVPLQLSLGLPKLQNIAVMVYWERTTQLILGWGIA
jgi:hypothetical protein